MKFPFKVLENLSNEQAEQWKKYYIKTETHDPKIEEGIWRRTQSFKNKEESGWKNPSDCRRRMLHYQHRFDVDFTKKKYDLLLKESYLFINYCLPFSELQNYEKILLEKIHGKWKEIKNTREKNFYCGNFSFGDLRLDINIYEKHPEDVLAKRKLPKNYSSIDITIYSNNFVFDKEFCKKPWDILGTGFRKKDKRQRTALGGSLKKIVEMLPAQVELGCGPSIEAGIPPLDYLHDIYCVSDRRSKKAMLAISQDKFLSQIIENPEAAFGKMIEMFKSCFVSEMTNFYNILKKLSDEGFIVGDIITNNFDGLARRAGLNELYVRRFENNHIIPDIKFHPLAKSLMVVGSHADRRGIHGAAREKGLFVVHIDPEGYQSSEGFIPYPVEDVLSGDALFPETATTAFEKIYNYMNSNKSV